MVKKLKKEIQKVIVAQEELIDSLIIALLSGGHILIEGMPGLAKTTAVKTFAKALGLENKRIQFTPDLLPSDIIGAQIFNPIKNDFATKFGPIFTNILLADEINRASPKVQSALLEAMQERQVTIAESSTRLPHPFLVLATQNPIEQEGTYPLPEAQLDRFMFKVVVEYASKEVELEILNRSEKNFQATIEQIADAQAIEDAQEAVGKVFADKPLKSYIVDLIVATREHPDTLYGASPRGAIDLLKASKAWAYMQGRDYITPQDILQNLMRTLRHRLILTYEAKAKGKSSEDILEEVAKAVPMP